MAEPTMRLSATVLDCHDPQALALFYERLLGWTRHDDTPHWVTLVPDGGGAGLSFQREPFYLPPIWPSSTSHQQMSMHLDLEVDDLAAATQRAVGCGAILASEQPQRHVRVLFDPAGHPFCLFVAE